MTNVALSLPTIRIYKITRCFKDAPPRTLSHIDFCSQGAGTDDDVLIEILASRTGEQIKDIVKAYKKGELVICEWEDKSR